MSQQSNRLARGVGHTQYAGFTLVELLVTISILAIVVSLAAPNMSDAIERRKLEKTAATWVEIFDQAKVESYILKTPTGVVYDETTGTVTITNETKADTVKTDADNRIAQYIIDDDVTLAADVALATPPDAITTFSSGSRTTTPIVLTLCSPSEKHVRQVSISTTASITNKKTGSC